MGERIADHCDTYGFNGCSCSLKKYRYNRQIAITSCSHADMSRVSGITCLCFPYSLLKHFTGLILAALMACDATVIHAINSEMIPATTKYQASRSM
jgi:hypothetical protein